MRLVVKKLEIADLGQLQSLVIEHLDGIESGLTVLDSRLLLGHATIDIVAIDTEGSLVLVTAGFTADEEMLMKAVEAYSWCLEYPDAIRRLYPSVEISAARPPRLMFVVERLPDAFHRKIKQLGFSEVDCVEFRYLDVSGTPAAYFDTIARLRRGPGLPEFTPAPIARRVSEPEMRRAPQSMGAERPAARTGVDRADKVVPLMSGPSTARATSVRLQKMLNTHGSSHGNGVAPVIEIAARVAPPAPRVLTARLETPAPHAEIVAPRAEAARLETPAPHIAMPTPHIEIPAPRVETPAAVVKPTARLTLREAIPAPTPAAASAPQAPERRVSFAEIAKELLGTSAPAPRLDAPAVIPRPAVEEITRATLEALAASAAAAVTETDSAVAIEDVPADLEIQEAVAALVKETAPEAVARPVIKPIVQDKPQPLVTAAPKSAFAAAGPKAAPAALKPAAAATAFRPGAAPAAKATTVAAPAPAPAAPPMPQEFEGLKFPNDGVLTRQWMEFLNQMASSK